MTPVSLQSNYDFHLGLFISFRKSCWLVRSLGTRWPLHSLVYYLAVGLSLIQSLDFAGLARRPKRSVWISILGPSWPIFSGRLARLVFRSFGHFRHRPRSGRRRRKRRRRRVAATRSISSSDGSRTESKSFSMSLNNLLPLVVTIV